MEQAIEKAIEGGWKWHGSKVKIIKRGNELRFQHDGFTERVEISQLLIDPSFCKAISNALGWKENYKKGDKEWETMTFEQMIYKTPHALYIRLMEHLWKEKDQDSFFSELFK